MNVTPYDTPWHTFETGKATEPLVLADQDNVMIARLYAHGVRPNAALFERAPHLLAYLRDVLALVDKQDAREESQVTITLSRTLVGYIRTSVEQVLATWVMADPQANPAGPVDVLHEGTQRLTYLNDVDKHDGRALPRAWVMIDGVPWVVALLQNGWTTEARFDPLVRYHREFRDKHGWPTSRRREV